MWTNSKLKVEGSLSTRSVASIRNALPQAMPQSIVNQSVFNDVYGFLLVKQKVSLRIKHHVKEILEEKSQKEVEHWKVTLMVGDCRAIHPQALANFNKVKGVITN
jgi:hypothetical protein